MKWLLEQMFIGIVIVLVPVAAAFGALIVVGLAAAVGGSLPFFPTFCVLGVGAAAVGYKMVRPFRLYPRGPDRLGGMTTIDELLTRVQEALKAAGLNRRKIKAVEPHLYEAYGLPHRRVRITVASTVNPDLVLMAMHQAKLVVLMVNGGYEVDLDGQIENEMLREIQAKVDRIIRKMPGVKAERFLSGCPQQLSGYVMVNGPDLARAKRALKRAKFDVIESERALYVRIPVRYREERYRIGSSGVAGEGGGFAECA